uniref:Uncharacterized protein n=1 Tax=Rangifer tarandus platyrhynchus TaxID=3082113 RepID=A0ACB0ESU1_RANTA|nr:unnamed protein product [Rangifer tarandus platyrhynchus]
MGLAALLQGQELRLAGPRDSAPSDSQARACRRSSGAPDPGRRLFSIVASRRCQEGRARGIALRPRSGMLGRISRMPGNVASAAGWYPGFSLHFEQPPGACSTRLRRSHCLSIFHISSGSCTRRTRRPQGSSGRSGMREADSFLSACIRTTGFSSSDPGSGLNCPQGASRHSVVSLNCQTSLCITLPWFQLHEKCIYFCSADKHSR